MLLVGERQKEKFWGVIIHFALERSLDRQSKVVGLNVSQLGQLSVDMVQMQQSDLLIEDLRQDVDANIELASGSEFDIFFAESRITSLV